MWLSQSAGSCSPSMNVHPPRIGVSEAPYSLRAIPLCPTSLCLRLSLKSPLLILLSHVIISWFFFCFPSDACRPTTPPTPARHPAYTISAPIKRSYRAPAVRLLSFCLGLEQRWIFAQELRQSLVHSPTKKTDEISQICSTAPHQFSYTSACGQGNGTTSPT